MKSLDSPQNLKMRLVGIPPIVFLAKRTLLTLSHEFLLGHFPLTHPTHWGNKILMVHKHRRTT